MNGPMVAYCPRARSPSLLTVPAVPENAGGITTNVVDYGEIGDRWVVERVNRSAHRGMKYRATLSADPPLRDSELAFKSATSAGFRCDPIGNRSGSEGHGSAREDGGVDEGGAGGAPAATAPCNECNEALGAVRTALATARHLALVAENALVNGDLRRAQAALRNLNDLAASETTLQAEPAPGQR